MNFIRSNIFLFFKKFAKKNLELIKILFFYLVDSFYFKIIKQKSSYKNSITIVRFDAIGDFIIYVSSNNIIPKQYLSFKKILICNELVFDVAKSLKIFDQIIPINLNKFKGNLIYRLQIYNQLVSLETYIALQPTFSRRFETGDSVIRFISAKIKIGFNGDFINQDKIFRLISDRWYNELIEPENIIKMEIERNHEFIEKVSKEKIIYKKMTPPILTKLNNRKEIKGRYIIISPGSSSKIKCWPKHNFQNLVKFILDKYKLKILICGTKSELPLMKDIIKNINSDLIHLSSNQTLIEYVEIIRNAELLIGNDSSSIHIANFVNTKSICLYGGILHRRFLPYPSNINNPPIICSNRDCKSREWKCAKYHNCLSKIRVEDVVDLIDIN